MAKAVIITGATGKQGGALIDALIKTAAGFELIAVSRNPSSHSAQKLASKSSKIKVVSGNLDKADDIFAAAKTVTSTPIWGVYSVQAMSMKPGDDTEVRQGKALVDAALRNNVKAFVYSSVDRGGEKSFDNPTPVPHFKTKHEIEHYLVNSAKGTDMSYTILRPVAFMDNMQPGFIGKVFNTIWKTTNPDRLHQIIAASDIGFFAAEAFTKPDDYKNRAVSLAGDELTYARFAQVFKEHTGNDLPTTYRIFAWLLLFMSHDLAAMFKWFSTDGYGADVAGLRRIHPDLKNFGTWLVQESRFETLHRKV